MAAGQRESITVFGDDYPTPDGTCIRDYVHVGDLADAHLLALPAPAAGEHRIYNLGNGTGFSVQEVVDAVREVTGHPVPVVVGERRAGDPAQLVASSDRIRADLGWAPRHTDLAGIVRDAWDVTRRAADRPGAGGPGVRVVGVLGGLRRGALTRSRAIRRPSSSSDRQRAALDLDGVADLGQPAELGEHVAGDRLVGPSGSSQAGGLGEVVEVEQPVDLARAPRAAACPRARPPRRTRRRSRR